MAPPMTGDIRANIEYISGSNKDIILAIIRNLEFIPAVFKADSDDRTLRIGFGRPIRVDTVTELANLTVEAETMWITSILNGTINRMRDANPGISKEALFLSVLNTFKMSFTRS